ncbi:MAG: murein biosynthesis integral membrane protein MurJ [Chromatiales bacterium]|nr:murein biosynthesis integral membrane protein MurJ [Chromatiales bacterium]
MSGRLLRATMKVGGNTLVSRILGFVRDVVVARAFGASAAADAFFVAFRIPNLLRRLFAEGAFSQAFVPVLSEYMATRPHEDARDLAAHVAGALGAILLIMTAAGIALAPGLVTVFAPGFLAQPAKHALAVDMVRITFPYILFISLASFAAGILNAHERFGAPAFAPVWLNLCLIGCALWLAPVLDEPVKALAYGVLLAGVVQLGFLIPFLAEVGMLVRPRLRRRHEGVRRVLKLIGPALFGVSVSQINMLLNTLIASFLTTGSITWLYYSDRMVEFPLGVFGIALATVILPSLSGRHATGSTEAFSSTLDWALRLVVLIAVPSTLGLVVLSEPILATLFRYGAFSADDVLMSARSLEALALGLLGFVGVKVLAPGYFARQDTRTPVRIGIMAMAANIVLNLVLVWPLAHAGLALATALAAYVNSGLLLRGLVAEGVYRPRPGWRRFALRCALANVAMVVVIVALRGADAMWLEGTALERAVRLGGVVMAGGVTYLVALLAVGLRPAQLVRAEGG